MREVVVVARERIGAWRSERSLAAKRARGNWTYELGVVGRDADELVEGHPGLYRRSKEWEQAEGAARRFLDLSLVFPRPRPLLPFLLLAFLAGR